MLQSNSFITCYCNLSAADVRLVIVVCSVAGGRILRASLINVKPNMASKQLIYWLLLKVIFCVTGWIFLLLGLEIISSITRKNNRFPKLDILGYLKNTTKITNLEEWHKSQPGNLVGNSLVGTCLTLPNFGFLWVFFKDPKISIIGNLLIFLCIRRTR